MKLLLFTAIAILLFITSFAQQPKTAKELDSNLVDIVNGITQKGAQWQRAYLHDKEINFGDYYLV